MRQCGHGLRPERRAAQLSICVCTLPQPSAGEVKSKSDKARHITARISVQHKVAPLVCLKTASAACTAHLQHMHVQLCKTLSIHAQAREFCNSSRSAGACKPPVSRSSKACRAAFVSVLLTRAARIASGTASMPAMRCIRTSLLRLIPPERRHRGSVLRAVQKSAPGDGQPVALSELRDAQQA